MWCDYVWIKLLSIILCSFSVLFYLNDTGSQRAAKRKHLMNFNSQSKPGSGRNIKVTQFCPVFAVIQVFDEIFILALFQESDPPRFYVLAPPLFRHNLHLVKSVDFCWIEVIFASSFSTTWMELLKQNEYMLEASTSYVVGTNWYLTNTCHLHVGGLNLPPTPNV